MSTASGTTAIVASPTCSSVPISACFTPPPGVSGPTLLMSSVKKLARSFGRPLNTRYTSIQTSSDVTTTPADQISAVMMRSIAPSESVRSRMMRKKTTRDPMYHHSAVPMIPCWASRMRRIHANAPPLMIARVAAARSSPESFRWRRGRSFSGESCRSIAARSRTSVGVSSWVT